MTKLKHDVKRFAYGETVEVQREPGSEWEDAIYRGKIADWRGWHTVQVRPYALRSSTLILPTKRIRAKKAP